MEYSHTEILWNQIECACLAHACSMLDSKTVPTEATVGTVERLINLAVQVDLHHLRWAQQNRCGARVLRDRPSLPQAKEN